MESVEADSHIPGWETRTTPCTRTARPEDTIYDSESDELCQKKRDWSWAFKLGYNTEPPPDGEDDRICPTGTAMAPRVPYPDGRQQPEEADSSPPARLSVRNGKLVNVTKKLDGIPDAIKKGTAGGRTWKEGYNVYDEWGEMRKEGEKKKFFICTVRGREQYKCGCRERHEGEKCGREKREKRGKCECRERRGYGGGECHERRRRERREKCECRQRREEEKRDREEREKGEKRERRERREK